MATLYTLKAPENQVADLEQLTGLSFQRSYLIYKVPAHQSRGKHRHRKNHSVLFCIAGSVTVFVQSVGHDALFQLNNPNQALHLLPSDWRMLYHFSPDCMVLALANEPYSKLDYVPDPYRPVYLPSKTYSLSQVEL